MNIQYKTVENEHEVRQILALQALNHVSNLGADAQKDQGFVTVKHDFDMLWAMNQMAPSIIAVQDGQLAGYCLMMSRAFDHSIPVLIPMFEMLDRLEWKGKPLVDQSWFVIGQVCVAREFRGMGIFDGLYEHIKDQYAQEYDMVITEVAWRNERSMHAHKRVGFEVLHSYQDSVTNENWAVVIWDWKKQA